ncbi:hypothetical protein BKA65DRAFT_415766, partial [Rhexocercosporidium sp. MPI-PUGE-AT-0058]
PPGVDKTLTAKALSEHLQRPLYTISARNLSSDTAKLEKQLSLHFELTEHWHALLLLNEADVFLRERDTDHIHNSLVSVFLRKLKYYQGIMLLTTNRVRDFNKAIQSRIHLALRYNPLGNADFIDENLNDLTKHDLNGRQVGTCFVEVVRSFANRFLLQIRNVVRAARALASQEGTVMSYSHLKVVINSGKEFQADAQRSSSENIRYYM